MHAIGVNPVETYIRAGTYPRKPELPYSPSRDAMQRDADIRGMSLPNTPPAEMASIHAALIAGLENGTLRPVIGKEFPLAQIPQAHRAVTEPGAFGKIVLVPNSKS